MFEKILNAIRGDQLPCGSAAAKPNCVVAKGHEGDLATRFQYV
jgi:hypothetical protein